MKNAINYNYKIFPSEFFEFSGGYYFYLNDYKYCLYEYYNEISYLNVLVDITNKLFYKKVMVHTFMKTFDNKYFIEFNGKIYVLLRINCFEDEKVSINDMLKFNDMISIDGYSVNVANWNLIWEKKVDVLEGEFNDLNKEYPLLQSVFNYYIGLSENAISYAKDAYNEESNFKINLQHRRVREGVKYGYFYNPLTFTFDYDVRDFAEYIKFSYFKGNLDLNEVENVIVSRHFSDSSLRLLFARLLYPSYFYDLCELILTDKVKEEELSLYLKSATNFEDVLLDIYFIIKKVCDIPPVVWLFKK